MPTQRRSITSRDQARPPIDQTTTSPDDDSAVTEAAPEVEPAADDGARRRRRIAERAYRRAERRGFAPGQELDDWLAAEAEEREGEDSEGER